MEIHKKKKKKKNEKKENQQKYLKVIFHTEVWQRIVFIRSSHLWTPFVWWWVAEWQRFLSLYLSLIPYVNNYLIFLSFTVFLFSILLSLYLIFYAQFSWFCKSLQCWWKHKYITKWELTLNNPEQCENRIF